MTPYHEFTWTVDGEEWRFRVFQDDCAESPREWDNLGTIVAWHPRYDIGDAQIQRSDAKQVYEQYAGDPKMTVLPVYLYEHSGMTISTQPFSCPWDSGQVGFIYASTEELGKDPREKDLETIRKRLVNEIEVYDQFIRGDVYYFLLERRQADLCTECMRKLEWELEDSCGGFYGDIEESGMLNHIEEKHRKFIELP